MEPKISVVIPSYNHEAYISDAITSVLGQSEPDFELIIVDDGSTDKSLEVISRFSDPRITVITQKNQGAHSAINRGLRKASGEHLAILNSDDAYHPKRLEKVVAALDANPQVGLVGSYIEIVDSLGKTLDVKHGYRNCSPWPLEVPERSFRAGDNLRAALLTENYWATTSNYGFSRSWYERVGEFRPLRYAHDWDFALRIARDAALYLLPEPLIRYRVHERNTISEDEVTMIFEICWCLAVHLPAFYEDKQILEEGSLEQLIERLLHSIYTFECDRVLCVMLLQELYKDSERALRLLEPDDIYRQKYLEFIDQRTAINQEIGVGILNDGEGRVNTSSDLRRSGLRENLSKLKAVLKSLMVG